MSNDQRQELADRIFALMRESPAEEQCDHHMAELLGVSWMDAYFALARLEGDRLVTARYEGLTEDGQPIPHDRQRRLWGLTTLGLSREVTHG